MIQAVMFLSEMAADVMLELSSRSLRKARSCRNLRREVASEIHALKGHP